MNSPLSESGTAQLNAALFSGPNQCLLLVLGEKLDCSKQPGLPFNESFRMSALLSIGLVQWIHLHSTSLSYAKVKLPALRAGRACPVSWLICGLEEVMHSHLLISALRKLRPRKAENLPHPSTAGAKSTIFSCLFMAVVQDACG